MNLRPVLDRNSGMNCTMDELKFKVTLPPLSPNFPRIIHSIANENGNKEHNRKAIKVYVRLTILLSALLTLYVVSPDFLF